MRTIKDVLDILNNNNWCKEEVEKAKKYISKLPLDMNAQEILNKIKNIPQIWLFYWAKDVGTEEEREIIKHKITDERIAYWWALEIGDEDLMKSKIKNKDLLYELEMLLKRTKNK